MSDWIPHKRDQCPVAKDAYVIVRWEGEECYGPNRADNWTWGTEDAPHEYMEVETVSKAHLDRLRAEVASLKEELASEQRWASDYMQQLAAANGRVEMLEPALRNLLWATTERDKKNRIRQFDEFVDDANAALSNLNEDGKA